MPQSFYPNLSSIVTVDQFPEQLQFVENGLQQVLEKIYYKNLQYVRNSDGTGGYYMTNEIHYRVSYLRKKLNQIPNGHIHVGFHDIDSDGGTATVRIGMFNDVHEMIKKFNYSSGSEITVNINKAHMITTIENAINQAIEIL